MIKESDNIQLKLINTSNIGKGNTFALNNERVKLQPSLDVDGFNLYKKSTILHNYDHLFTYNLFTYKTTLLCL